MRRSARSINTNLKVNPPIRTEDDRMAVIEGLVDGTIDCIASDHAPHSAEEKDCEFDQAPSGMIGLETTLGLVKTYLIDKGYLDWADAIRKMTANPARIFGLQGGTLAKGLGRGYHDHRPGEEMDGPRRQVPLEVEQLAVYRYEADRPGRQDSPRRQNGLRAIAPSSIN